MYSILLTPKLASAIKKYTEHKNQRGYQEIQHLLESTSNSPEVNQLRAIYDGYVTAYKSFGYDEEDARVMAGRTVGAMITLHGVNGTFTIPKINKIFGSNKLLAAGKETNANKPLDKDYFESEYGKGNVEQGGGNYKEIKDKILEGQRENQKANESSNFGDHVKNEKEINAGKGTNVKYRLKTRSTSIFYHLKLSSIYYMGMD